jgi:hypothetical protein
VELRGVSLFRTEGPSKRTVQRLKLTLRFTDDEEAEFNIPNVGQALGAVQYCQANKK